MLRMSFDQKLAENVGEHSLSMFMHVHVSGLHMQLVFMHTRLCSCVHKYVLEVLRKWEWTYIRGVLPLCVGFDPCM